MKSARLLLEERNEAWQLIIEPWALAFDVPAGTRVHIEVFDEEDNFHLEIADEGTFLAFDSGRFSVAVGETRHEYDFQIRASAFDTLWPPTG